MGILTTLVIGLLIGIVARFLKPGPNGMGWVMTIVLGIAGSIFASYGGEVLGIYHAGEPAGFVGAVVGAVVLLFIVEALRKR